MKSLHNNRGDTIVEVLISITALSLILSASYGLANRNTHSFQQAAERGQAVKVTESQVETLKQYAAIPSRANLIPGDGAVFCMKPGNVGPAPAYTVTPPTVVSFDPATLPSTDAGHENFNAFSTHPECKTGEFYYTYIQRQGDTFTAHTRWYSATGHGVDEATMVYRVYPDNVAINGDDSLASTGCPINWFRPAAGGCISCSTSFPPNYISAGAESPTCVPKPPEITFTVKMVSPPANKHTPNCSSNNTEVRNGATVTFENFGSAPTATLSTVMFTLDSNTSTFGRSYNVSFAAPTGTNPDGTTPSFTLCDTAQNPKTVTVTIPALTGGAGNTQSITPIFKFIPNCYVADDYGTIHHSHTVHHDAETHVEYAWYHEHPLDKYPYDPINNDPGNLDGRYEGTGWGAYDRYATETYGGINFEMKYQYDKDAGLHTTGYYYVEFVKRPYTVTDKDAWDETVADPDTWGIIGHHDECPI